MGQHLVGMGVIQVSKDPQDILVALGLGSCIGVCAYDRVGRIAGMAHVVLPELINAGEKVPGKYAPTAVPALLDEMKRLGAMSHRIQIALAGGAQLFSFNGGTPRLDVGQRNGAAVLATLTKFNLPVLAQDIGGNAGRTIHFYVGNGRITVKTLDKGEQDLVLLGTPLTARAIR